MAELQNYANGQQLEALDKTAQSEHHEETRLKTAATTAKQSVTDMTDYIGTLDEDEGNRINFRLDVWNSNSYSKAETVREDVRTRVMDMVGNSAVNYLGNLDNSAYGPNLESLAWNGAATDVHNMIDRDHENGTSSLRVIEAYEKFINTAKEKKDTRWKRRKDKNTRAINKMGKWEKRWKRKFGLKKNIETYNAHYNRDVDTALKKVFTDLNAKVTDLKDDAKERVTDMAERIEDTWDVAMFDPARKQALWDEIKIAAAHRGGLNSLNLTEFGINSEQGKVDFVEALLQLDFVKKGLGIKQESETKHQRQKDSIQNAESIETAVRGCNFRKFEQVRNFGALGLITPSENEVSAGQLVNILIDDLVYQGVDVETRFFNGLTGANLLTDSARLALIVNNLNEADFQSLEAKQAYVDWFEGTQKKVNGGYEAYSNHDTLVHVNNLEQPGGILDRLATVWTEAGQLDISNKTHNTARFQGMADGTRLLLSDSQAEKEAFEVAKNSLSEADRTLLEDRWTEIDQRLKELSEFAPKVVQEKKAYEAWERVRKEKVGDRNQIVQPSRAALGARGFSTEEQARLIGSIKFAEDTYNEHLATAPVKTVIPSYEASLATISRWTGGSLRPRISPNKNAPIRLEDGIAREIVKNFSNEVEAIFLQKMEENDQFELIKKCAEGDTVNIEHKVVSGVQTIKFPNQLNTGTHTDDYQVIRKTEGAVLLENSHTNTTITIVGAAVKGGKPYKNAIISRPGVVGGNANAIITNLKIS